MLTILCSCFGITMVLTFIDHCDGAKPKWLHVVVPVRYFNVHSTTGPDMLFWSLYNCDRLLHAYAQPLTR